MKGTVFIKIAFPSLREQKDNVVLAGGTIRPLGNLWEAGPCWRKVSWYHGNVKDFECLWPTLASSHSIYFVFRVGDVIAQFFTSLLLLCLAHTPGTASLSNSFMCCFWVRLCCLKQESNQYGMLLEGAPLSLMECVTVFGSVREGRAWLSFQHHLLANHGNEL